MSDIREIQTDAPPGVVISSDPETLPSYPLQPELRTPLRRRADGPLELVLLAQSVTNGTGVILSVPDVLGINGESQIGLSRANRIMPAGQTSIATPPRADECTICPPPRGDRLTFAMDNGRPFGPLLHKLVCTRKHHVTLPEVSLAELRDATELFYEIVKGERKSRGELLDGLTIGMNFGDYARSGASQIHFHYQVAGLGKANYNAGDRLGALCRAYRDDHDGGDYLEDYRRALRVSGLVLMEKHQAATAYAPISPRFKGEVQIMLDRSVAGNILDTNPEERDALADLQWQMMQRFARLGCNALNQVWYMTRLSAENDYGQRLVISLYPRTSVFAFYELSGNHVIDALPWTTARTLRAAADLHFRLS